ncbi:hypothetical protein [Persicobacter diffluens]|uniref:Uncharacterized protein n=1 Tax=Persicobacter diffluens TaxID=981 RepID=A0AAN4W3I8_9BACT|nr:hypothetical protein PEDI_51950 [Persicobacter diffluens]
MTTNQKKGKCLYIWMNDQDYEAIKKAQNDAQVKSTSAYLKFLILQSIRKGYSFEGEDNKAILKMIQEIGSIMTSSQFAMEECKKVILLGHRHGRVKDEQVELLIGVIETYTQSIRELTNAYRKLISNIS